MNSLIQKSIKHFSQFFLRQHCLLCHSNTKTALAVCSNCLLQLPWLQQGCITCGLPLSGKSPVHYCGQCLNKPVLFEHTIALFEYNTPVNRWINELKFHGRLLHAALFGQLLAQKIAEYAAPLPEMIIPIPLHRNRLKERGYNQALEIARPIAQQLGIPINRYDCERIINTLPQSKIPAAERRTNLRNAFYCPPMKAKHVAIVDDVVTTTSTIRSLATTLHQAGVSHIDIWCVARTNTAILV